MTSWLPQLKRSAVPLYREIAQALADDIAAARLAPGSRLPTHRELAWQLGVTVGTVSRAYAEAERRGLIGGEIGRGTFVLPSAPETASGPADGFIDLSLNYALTGHEAPLLDKTLAELIARRELAALLPYLPASGVMEHRTAAADWLRRRGLSGADPDRIVITTGGQHALAVAVAALARPGDTVAVECLTYPGFKAVARQFGVQLAGVAIDDLGMQPEALDAVCRTRNVRFLFTMPTLQNPTTAVMPEERRREIAAICRRHDIVAVEDDVYGFLCDPALPPLVNLLPERGVYLTSLSKCFAPGLRVGYLHAPVRGAERFAAAAHATGGYMAPPLMAAIASRWIADTGGDGERLAAEKRRLVATRQAIVRSIVDATRSGATLATHPHSLHCWLILPPGWRAEEFAAAARERGVGVTPAGAFAVGATAGIPEAVRFSLGTPATADLLERAMHLIAATLEVGPSPYLSVV